MTDQEMLQICSAAFTEFLAEVSGQDIPDMLILAFLANQLGDLIAFLEQQGLRREEIANSITMNMALGYKCFEPHETAH